MHRPPHPVSHKLAHDAEPVGLHAPLYGAGDIAHAIPRQSLANPFVERLLRYINQLLRPGIATAHHIGAGSITNKPLHHNADIQTHDIPILDSTIARHPMHNLFIHRDAHVAWITPIPEKSTLRSVLSHEFRRVFVDLSRRHSGCDPLSRFFQDCGRHTTGSPHGFNIAATL